METVDFDFGEWTEELQPVLNEEWCRSLLERVDSAYEKGEPRVFPPKNELFTALRLTPPSKVKCVIIGQDPYHEYGQAHGLSFSVKEGVKIPPSLKNIYKELSADLGVEIPAHGCLEKWAEQGVLLLNSVLSVYEGDANSHKKWGWEKFTSQIVQIVEKQKQPIAYILWGRQAQEKKQSAISSECESPRLLIESVHPSPLSASRGFFGSRPFSAVNNFLVENGSEPIDWKLK